ncbi:hypothetical protein ACOSP7_028267 [Xanthoceras sorbifolium]
MDRNLIKGILVQFACEDPAKVSFQGNEVGSCFVEDFDEVAKVDYDIGIGRIVINEMEGDKDKFLEGGLSIGPGQ